MQTFWIVILSILLPLVCIIELFRSREKTPEPEAPAVEEAPAGKKAKSKKAK